jgi:hypothetical protein
VFSTYFLIFDPMRNQWVIFIGISLFIACSKDKPIPVVPLSCGPIPTLEGVWISDSSRHIYLDSNSVVLWDLSGPSAFPTNYLKLQFFCEAGTPRFFGEYWQNSIYGVSHDSSNYNVYGNIIYYHHDPAVTDTALMAKKYIEYLSPTQLHIRWTAFQTGGGVTHDYYYMHK